MNHQEEKSPESRERILDAALEEFGAWGYESASTNRVCRQAEISKGLLFHYYKTKQTNMSRAFLSKIIRQAAKNQV